MAATLVIVGGASYVAGAFALRRSRSTREIGNEIMHVPMVGFCSISQLLRTLMAIAGITCQGMGAGIAVAGITILTGFSSYATISFITAGALATAFALCRLV